MLKNINTTFIFHITFSTAILIWILSSLHVIVSIKMFIGLILYICCAVCIQSCIMIVFAVPAFWIIKSNGLVNTAIYGFRNFNTYPMNIYGKGIRGILTFVIPYAFVSYYPAMFVLGKCNSNFDFVMLILEPVITLLLLFLTFILWNKGIKRYSSAGN